MLAIQYIEGLIQLMPDDLKSDYAYTTGASEVDIQSLQAAFPLCSSELIALLKEVNGTYHQKYGEHVVSLPILGSDVGDYPYYLKSVAQIIEDTNEAYNQETIQERYEQAWIEDGLVKIDKKIDPKIQMKEWLCFSDCINNGGTSRLYIDFKPTKYGKVGQVIRYLHDPDSFKVIAESFEAYLTQVMAEDYPFTEIYEDWE